ncbi:hypothetical protein PHMEG_0009388 [Phytophthora megakarya]|uniref:Uncharacterized protein n=1 Tax=Phytophthora megakarya TaxID=4795 RepID=A0A225WGX2_9STRA|nr:hypothetical protein PHMEG_0009388 [Phytophthora megakarya]
MDQYPQHFGLVERQLLKQGRTLEQHCINRESGGFSKTASPCINDDLKKMMMYLYTNASTSTDNQDAGLLCLPWLLFGRPSDLIFVRKQQLSIYDDNVFFIRLIRVKTSEEQCDGVGSQKIGVDTTGWLTCSNQLTLPPHLGPIKGQKTPPLHHSKQSLFPDEDYAMCPLLVGAMALITQAAPCAALLNHLSDEVKSAPLEVSASIPLLERLGHPPTSPTQATASTPSTNKPMYESSAIGIHAQVNRLLNRVSHPAVDETSLSSHSFRRGGAQHANTSSKLTTQRIFDRGALNLATTNKTFAYVFHTPKEDHEVGKVLSGMTPKQAARLPSLACSTPQDENAYMK